MATDDFTDTNGTLLATHDAKWIGTNGDNVALFEIQSNGCEQNSGFTLSQAHYDDSQSEDQLSEIVVAAAAGTRPVNSRIVVTSRSTTSRYGYTAHILSNTGACVLLRNGAFLNTLGTPGNATDGFTFKIETETVAGDVVIKVYYDGAQVGSTYTDTTGQLFGGFPGMGILRNGGTQSDFHFDSWTDGITPGPTGAIMNQLQGANLGADLFNGTIQ